MPDQNRNYAKELERLIARQGERVPTLLLHACCAPCSSAVLEYLTQYFQISLLYYNPNIAPFPEYEKRLEELKRLLACLPMKHRAVLVPSGYDGQAFQEAVKGLEDQPEGGSRCLACYRLRLREAAKEAQERGLEYFTTTLTISPLKNARAINAIGEEVGKEFGVKHLPSDFKKREGYKRSVELSKEYGLYRQNYCGCVYSKAQRDGKANTESADAS